MNTLPPGIAWLPQKAMAIGAGHEAGLAIVYALNSSEKVDRDVTGNLYGWGKNYRYQLSGEKSGSIDRPRLLTDREHVYLAGGAGSIYAVDYSGKLTMSGEGTSGQLGDGTRQDSSQLSQLKTPLKAADNSEITDVLAAASAINGKHSLYIAKDGTVWTFGDNSSKQLGLQTVVGSADKAVQIGATADIDVNENSLFMKIRLYSTFAIPMGNACDQANGDVNINSFANNITVQTSTTLGARDNIIVSNLATTINNRRINGTTQ